MFLDATYSQIGRATHTQLNALRRQLGVGIDPAYDYTEITELQKKLAAKEKKLKDPAEHSEGTSGSPLSGLDQLRRALREVVGGSPGQEDGEGEEAGADEAKSLALSPQDVRSQREQTRPSRSFQSPSRHDISKLDIDNPMRFRAPPVGTYQPSDDLSRPRLHTVDFGLKNPTKSRKVMEVEKEIERLRSESLPFDHLTKSYTSVEMLEDTPEKPKARMPDYHIQKLTQRPDIVKAHGIVYNVNSFTAGVLDGDLRTSQLTRHPQWDFAKTSTGAPLDHGTYFEPGQYNVNIDTVRPKAEKKNIPFTKQMSRKPLREVIGRVEISERLGDHLPDRSLSRTCPMAPRDSDGCRSCPLLSKELRVNVPNMDHYSVRPSIIPERSEYHRTDDPDVDLMVTTQLRTFDATKAKKPVQPRMRPADKFDKSLKRADDWKRQRAYGENIPIALAKENQKNGPVTVELLSDIDDKPSLRHRVKTRDIARMAGRDNSQEYTESPPRRRDLSGAAQFERGIREGDSRCKAMGLSQASGTIADMRATRHYEALSLEQASS